MTTARQVANWLRALPQVTKAEACNVTIRGTTTPAARYLSLLTTPEGSEAYRRGERTYQSEMLYCVGPLPRCYIGRNVCFTVENDPREWYVAAYYPALTGARQPETEGNAFHPFGRSFLLAPWSLAERIDRYARTPYRRYPMKVEPCAV